MLAAVTAHNGLPMVPASDPVTIRVCAPPRFFQPRIGSYAAVDDAVTALALSQTRTEH
jgi:hypothetical protein